MRLSILAAILHGMASAIYVLKVHGGEAVPNPTSWTIWALLSALNALTFWRASKDALATTQFFTGTAMCLIVWGHAMATGKFSRPAIWEVVVLVACFGTCLVWWLTRNATYTNLTVGGILLVSSLPTIFGVWRKDSVPEDIVPWILWTAAFATTTLNVVLRRDRKKNRWWLLLAVPIVGILVHAAVAAGIVAR